MIYLIIHLIGSLIISIYTIIKLKESKYITVMDIFMLITLSISSWFAIFFYIILAKFKIAEYVVFKFKDYKE